jgi:hypothetical protein
MPKARHGLADVKSSRFWDRATYLSLARAGLGAIAFERGGGCGCRACDFCQHVQQVERAVCAALGVALDDVEAFSNAAFEREDAERQKARDKQHQRDEQLQATPIEKPTLKRVRSKLWRVLVRAPNGKVVYFPGETPAVAMAKATTSPSAVVRGRYCGTCIGTGFEPLNENAWPPACVDCGGSGVTRSY